MMLNKLSLNTIGLNRIGLNRIGKPSRGSSDRPYIDPEVLASLKAVCICYGKSNDDPDRAIVKNLVDPDNPFVISNAAFKLNSGFGKYSADFESFDWAVNISQKQHNKATISLNGRLCNHAAIEVDEMKVNIIGNVTELIYWYIANPDDTTRSEIRLTSGINTLPKSYAKDDGQTYNIGFAYISGDSEITIEQIPSFEGAFVTDGINDLITSTKTVQEMLGGSNEITIVSMVHQVKDTTNNTSFTNYIRGSINGYFRNIVNNYGKTGIYGYTSSDLRSLSVINNILGDKNDYTSNGDNRDTIINGNFNVQGYSYNNSNNTGDFSSVAWYWTVIANKVLTTDQINQVIAYYNLDRCVEPTVLYDVKRQGLSNDTPDSDWYLKDYSGNGYDMTLYNYAKTPESGINEDGGLQSDGVDDYGKVTGMPIYKDYTVVTDREIFANIGAISSKNNSGAFVETAGNSVYSFGQATSGLNFISTRSISYLSKYSYCGQSITAGAAEDGTDMWLGTIRDNDSRFFNGAIYSLMSFPYSMSEFLIERQLKKHKLGTLYPDMVEFRPVIKTNVDYTLIQFYINNYTKRIYPGDYIPINTPIEVNFYLKNNVDELISFKVNGNDSTFKRSTVVDNAYNIRTLPITKSPQKIDITIDEYIRYEDIVQPYPEMWVITQNAKKVSWGDKLKVGSEFGYNSKVNLLSGLYSTANSYYNGKVVKTGDVLKVEKQMVFACDYSWIGGSNEPKCILSPSRLRIPNSSYKILGYIPDISGHGNHGKINNSAYAGMSGANGYVENFTTWGVYNGAILTDNTIKTNSNFNPVNSWVAYKGANTILNSFSVNITGIPEGGILNFRVNADTFIELSNGRNDLSFDNIPVTVSSGFRITKGSNLDWSNLVIQQIGQYEGAYCLDGVDDFITIPTTVGGKQVLMKVNWQSSIGQGMLYDQRGTAFAIWNSDKYNDDETDTIPAYSARNGGNTYIDGILNKNILASQLRNITHNIVATNTMLNESSVSPTIGCRTEHDAYFTNMSLYDFMLFDEISTDEEILTLNEYVGIEGNTDDLFTENN